MVCREGALGSVCMKDGVFWVSFNFAVCVPMRIAYGICTKAPI